LWYEDQRLPDPPFDPEEPLFPLLDELELPERLPLFDPLEPLMPPELPEEPDDPLIPPELPDEPDDPLSLSELPLEPELPVRPSDSLDPRMPPERELSRFSSP
jgi:hypothetical protein